ncbi:alpha/beta hydrolase [Kitasatospora sp. NPDC056327]|uniref:alpha/beta hydrolase n=1 Tax=Kitasatospora sp. NPDC056327 TaxID=3345785 RepID=UPI0035DBD96B
MISRFSRRALPAVAVAALLAGCTGSGGSTDAPTAPSAAELAGEVAPELRVFYGQRLAWKPCDGEAAVQCATLRVPLDYADPAGGTFDVAVARIGSSDPGRRIGSLVVNPGGPGNSGVDMVRGGRNDYDGPLRDHYDIVGFDPRGAGRSSPVNCLDDRARDEWLAADVSGPEHGKVLGDACLAKYGKLLTHLGTRDSARDMDVLRAVLGDRRLSYLGMSYGSYLGSVYTEEFPDRVGRLVLDGAIDPAKPQAATNIEQYGGYERALHAFAADCARRAGCPFGDDPDRAAERAAGFLDGLGRRPLRTEDGRLLTSVAAWSAVFEGLSGDEGGWDSLANALDRAVLGRGDDLLAYADGYRRRGQDGRYSNSVDAYTAIYCADGATEVPAGDALKAAYQELAARAPLVTRHEPAAELFDPDCRGWPFRSPEKAHPIGSKATTPIVVVGSTGDPVTTYANARQLTAQLGNAVLLTREGEGHTAYARSGCVRAAVRAYFVDGTVPAAGTRCASDPVR